MSRIDVSCLKMARNVLSVTTGSGPFCQKIGISCPQWDIVLKFVAVEIPKIEISPKLKHQ